MLGANLLCSSNAFASVRMYALWYPSTSSGQGAAVANSGATIGGQFAVRVVVQPEQGEGTIVSASIIQQSIRELTNAHPVTSGQLAEFQRVDPNPQYGDPTSNVVVLESPFMNLARHNGTYQIEVTVSYVVATGNPPPNNWRTINPPPVSMTLTMNNLVLLVDSWSEPYFVWNPAQMTGVPFSAQIQHAQSGVCTLRLEIFTSENNQTPILVKEFTNVPRPGVWQWEWDGKLADGTIAPRGVYSYRLSAVAYVPTLPDGDSNRSSTLQIAQTKLEIPEGQTNLLFSYYLTEAGSYGFILVFDPTPQDVMMYDTDVTTNAGWNSVDVILPPGREEMPPGAIRYLVYVADRGDTNGMDKAHRSRWALPLNQQVPLYLVIIDPGHDRQYNPGSHGYDAQGNIHYEKDVTLSYALTLKAQMLGQSDSQYPGHPREPNCPRQPPVCAWKPALTRQGDIAFPPSDRQGRVKAIIKQWVDDGGQRRDVFLISLHCDGSHNSYVRGVSVGYCRYNPFGEIFCDTVGLWIDGEMTETEVPSVNYWECENVKGTGNHLYILRQGFLPEAYRVRATLVELGFMTNPQDLAQLLDRIYRIRETRAIHYGCDWCLR